MCAGGHVYAMFVRVCARCGVVNHGEAQGLLSVSSLMPVPSQEPRAVALTGAQLSQDYSIV